jgi:HlyD family secretion protein
LLVEFDSSQHQERLDRQILLTERAKSERLQAQAKYDNQITQNETSEAEAELQVKLTELELLMFTDQEAGTHQLEVEEIKRLIDDTNSEILAAQANLELRNNDQLGIESLFKLGYAGKNELDRSRLDFLQAEGQFAAKMNRLADPDGVTGQEGDV